MCVLRHRDKYPIHVIPNIVFVVGTKSVQYRRSVNNKAELFPLSHCSFYPLFVNHHFYKISCTLSIKLNFLTLF